MLPLKDRTAIITGGGTGIGRALATAFVKADMNVAIMGRRSEPLQVVRAQCQSLGREILLYQGDVSNESDVTGFIGKVMDQYQRIDLLVNNAGIDGQGYIHEQDAATWDKVMAVNLRGPFLTAHYTLPIMRSQKSGHIINISSEAGLEYEAGMGAYGVSKHALNALGEFIQVENQDFGIHVNTICPGVVVTPMTQDEADLHVEKSLVPEDIADLVMWIISKKDNLKIGLPVLIQTMLNPWI